MTGHEWIAEFADKLGVEPPDRATFDVLLDLAGVAAHSSERSVLSDPPRACAIGLL